MASVKISERPQTILDCFVILKLTLEMAYMCINIKTCLRCFRDKNEDPKHKIVVIRSDWITQGQRLSEFH